MMYPKATYIGDKIRQKYVDRHLPAGTGRLLDVGAGNGQYYWSAVEKGYSYEPIDSNPGDGVLLGDAYDLDFEKEWADVILCVDVLEHLTVPEDVVPEFLRVLKSEGLCLVHVPNKDQKHILVDPVDNPDHVRLGFDVDELKELFSDFVDVRIISTFSSMECIAWELVYAQSHGLKIDPLKIVSFDWKTYQPLGWLILARKK